MTDRVRKSGEANRHVGNSGRWLGAGSVGYHHVDFRDKQHGVEQGKHDEDITREEILSSGLVSEKEYALIEKYTMEVFMRGTEIASRHGLILVDTKYEFGKKDGKIYLIDEINTPDSSRYFYVDEYQERFDKGLPQ